MLIPLEAVKKNYVVFLLTSGGFPAVFGITWLCGTCPHSVFMFTWRSTCVPLHVCTNSSSKDTTCVGLRLTSHDWLDYFCKSPISQVKSQPEVLGVRTPTYLSFLKKNFFLFLTVLSLCCYLGLFSSFREWELLSDSDVEASHYSGFSCGAWALGCTGSIAAATGL